MSKNYETDEQMNDYWENAHDTSIMPDIIEKDSIFIYRTVDDPAPSFMHYYECMACDDVQSAAKLIQHTVLKEAVDETDSFEPDSDNTASSERLSAFCTSMTAELNACQDISDLSDVCEKISSELPDLCECTHHVHVIRNGIRGVISLAVSKYPIYADDFIETMAGFHYAFMNADSYDEDTEEWAKKAFQCLQFGS